VFNIDAYKTASPTFLQELIKILQDAGIGVLNDTIFATTEATIPEFKPPQKLSYLGLIETGGTTAVRIQNTGGVPAYERPSAQITAYGMTSEIAKALAYSAYLTLASVRNLTVDV
jgi:hypothetical protein